MSLHNNINASLLCSAFDDGDGVMLRRKGKATGDENDAASKSTKLEELMPPATAPTIDSNTPSSILVRRTYLANAMI